MERVECWTGYAWAMAAVLAATAVGFALRFALRGRFDPVNIAMVYTFAVVVIAARFTRGAAMSGSMLSVGAFDFFFVPPYGTFTVDNPEYLFTFVVMVAVALVISRLAEQIRRHARGEAVAEQLRKSERQLREITDSVPAIIAKLDLDGRFLFHNRFCQEHLGIAGDRINGHRLEDIIGPAAYEGVRRRIEQVLQGSAVAFERERVMPNGTWNVLSGHLLPCYEENDPTRKIEGFYAMLTDITELKRIDRMKSEFVSVVSHELRTPLTSIRGSLGLVAGGVAGKLPEAARKLIDIANGNCERLIRLINDILDTEKIESGKMQFNLEDIELGPFMRQAVAANEGFASQHGVRLELGAMPFPVRVNADADRLVQVLTNLLSNAIKFSPALGRVMVGVAATADRIRITVADQGPGIPQAFRPRIFQKFAQGDASDARGKGGTGLGLSISKAIVEHFGGTIGFTSEEGRGTTFHVDLPRRDTAAALPVADADHGHRARAFA